ncbi:MAG: ATP-binding protein [Chloroflexi bacterium]|nr:ATP-binding protein [Chloroflexota bacterium]
MFRSLNLKLTLAFALVVLLAIGTVALVANRSMVSEFTTYLQSDPQAQADHLATGLADLYSKNGSWDGVTSFMSSEPAGIVSDWVLVDASGNDVAASRPALLHVDMQSLDYEAFAPVISNGQTVGAIYVSSVPMSAGQGNGMMGMGNGMGSMHQQMVSGGIQVLGTAEQNFVDSFNHSLLLAGGVSGALALILGIVFMTQITSPVRRLTHAAKRIASGDLSQRVHLKSKDEIGELAETFNRMAENLSQNEKTRRVMVADIAHELRTPLTVLQGNLEAMMDGVVQPTRDNIKSLHDESLLLNRLVGDLRELSLAESGQLKLHRQPTNLGDLVGKVISGQRSEAEEKRIAVELQTDNKLPLLNVDPDRVSQIVRNLISNAIRYTPDGGKVAVSIRPLVTGEAKAMAEIAVTDNGCGIDAEDLPYVFDRFYRTDRSRSRARGGSGIGLAIVKQLAELHGGAARVTSQAGLGSTFSVILPVSTG